MVEKDTIDKLLHCFLCNLRQHFQADVDLIDFVDLLIDNHVNATTLMVTLSIILCLFTYCIDLYSFNGSSLKLIPMRRYILL